MGGQERRRRIRESDGAECPGGVRAVRLGILGKGSRCHAARGNDRVVIAKAATVDQLLGYVSWRDTKTAIIIFTRETQFSTVLRGAFEAMEAHSNCKHG